MEILICEYCNQEMALIVVKNEHGVPIEVNKCFNCGNEKATNKDNK